MPMKAQEAIRRLKEKAGLKFAKPVHINSL